jgi:bifunctional oligoribonuclease and PAP phosphatase NrnA
MTSKDLEKFAPELNRLGSALRTAKRVLITAPAAADGDSVGSQLALRRMILHKFPSAEVAIVNDEPLPPRYLFIPESEHARTPETYAKLNEPFDVAFVVDGGVDRAGRVRAPFESAKTRVFIDHHAVSAQCRYDIRIVEASCSANTELIWYISQSAFFETPLTQEFAQHIYLGLIFDTAFFRHSNTTPEAMELGARMIRTGFDFTRVGERGMLARTFPSQKLMSDTLRRAELLADGKIIWAALYRETLRCFDATADDREGIIDQLFLTQGIEVAVLFLDLGGGETKVSFRSQGPVDVAEFARSLTEHGGGHRKAAGANFSLPIHKTVELVLGRLKEVVGKSA